MYEVLMVLIITDFEWTWLSYIIDIIYTYSNTYTYMSCTWKKWESLYRHSLLLHPIHKQLWTKMLKTMHVSKTVENCWICLPLRNRLFLRLCPACVIDMHCVSCECTVVVFCFCFFFGIRICIIVLDILTFQDRFLYLYKIKISKNKLY
jgi:hypothetical protein